MPLAMLCYGKARRNQESAAKEVIRRGASDNRSYRCLVCSTWHVGHYEPAREALVIDGFAAAERIIRETRAAGFGWYLGKLADDWHPRYAHRDPVRNWRSRLTA